MRFVIGQKSARTSNPFRGAATRTLGALGGAPKWFRAPARAPNPGQYHYGRWGQATMAPNVTPTPIQAGNIRYAGATTASPPFRCWGPDWDRTCKLCAPLPSGGETCSVFKINSPF